METLADTILNQAAKAHPGTEVVYSLIILILIAISILFFYLYRSERKLNNLWTEKSLKATELLSSVHLRLEDQRRGHEKFLEFASKLDILIEYASDLKELRKMLEALRHSLKK